MPLTSQDYWRALILYGKNQSTYKIALGKILLQYSEANREKIPMNELAEDFFNLYSDRVKKGRPQGSTLGRKTFVEQEVIANPDGRPSSKTIEVIKKKSYFSIRNHVSPVLAFYNINDIVLNVNKIVRYIPPIKRGPIETELILMEKFIDY